MRLKTLVAVLTALLSLAAISATAASAHEWQRAKHALLKTEKFESKADVRFELSSVEGNESFECEYNEKGTVGIGAGGKITSVTNKAGSKVIECSHPEGIRQCEVYDVEARDLPWATELFESESHVRDRIMSGGEGPPEWHIFCGKGGGFSNKCSFETSTRMENFATGPSPEVKAYFEPKFGLDCVYGAAEHFHYNGKEVIHASNYDGLEAN